MQLTAVELLRGGKVVGVAARVTRRTVVLGSATMTLKPGQHTALKVALNAAGQHLLATHKHLTTKLVVTRKMGNQKAKAVTSKTVAFKSTKKH